MERIEKFIPEACQREGAPIKGHVMLRAPTFTERMSYVEKCGITYGADGQAQFAKGQLQSVVAMIECSRSHYREVEFTKADGTKVTSFEEMETDPDFDEILSQVGGQVMNGFRPGKKSNP